MVSGVWFAYSISISPGFGSGIVGSRPYFDD